MTLFDASHIFVDVDAASRDEAFALGAAKAVELGIGSNADALIEGLKQREAAGSTAMALGLAIPHCKSTDVSVPGVVFLRFAQDVSWQGASSSEISAAIFLFMPDDEAATSHLQILSKLAVSMMQESFCDTLKTGSIQEISDAITKSLAD